MIQVIEAKSSKRSMDHRKGCLKHHEEGADNNTEKQDEVSASGKKVQFEESMNQHQNMKGQVTKDSNTKPSADHGLRERCAIPDAAQPIEQTKRADVVRTVEQIRAQSVPPGDDYQDIEINDVIYFVKAP